MSQRSKFLVDRDAAEAAAYEHDHEMLRKGIRDDEIGVTYILTTSDPDEAGRMCKIGFSNRVPVRIQSDPSAIELAKFCDWAQHYGSRPEAEVAAARHRGEEYARRWALPFKLDVVVATQFTPYASGLETKLHTALRRRRWKMMRADCPDAARGREIHGDRSDIGSAWKASPNGPSELFNYSPEHASILMADLSPEAQVLKIIRGEADRLESEYKKYVGLADYIDGFIDKIQDTKREYYSRIAPWDDGDFKENMSHIFSELQQRDDLSYANGEHHANYLLDYPSFFKEFVDYMDKKGWYFIELLRAHEMGLLYDPPRPEPTFEYLQWGLEIIEQFADEYGYLDESGDLVTRRRLDFKGKCVKSVN